jgi:hypothetical protein
VAYFFLDWYPQAAHQLVAANQKTASQATGLFNLSPVAYFFLDWYPNGESQESNQGGNHLMNMYQHYEDFHNPMDEEREEKSMRYERIERRYVK